MAIRNIAFCSLLALSVLPASASMEEAGPLPARYFTAQFNLGNAALSEGRYNEALQIFQNAEALFPEKDNTADAELWESIGYCYQKLGQMSKAEEALRMAVSKFDVNSDVGQSESTRARETLRVLVSERVRRENQRRDFSRISATQLVSGTQQRHYTEARSGSYGFGLNGQPSLFQKIRGAVPGVQNSFQNGVQHDVQYGIQNGVQHGVQYGIQNRGQNDLQYGIQNGGQRDVQYGEGQRTQAQVPARNFQSFSGNGFVTVLQPGQQTIRQDQQMVSQRVPEKVKHIHAKSPWE